MIKNFPQLSKEINKNEAKKNIWGNFYTDVLHPLKIKEM